MKLHEAIKECLESTEQLTLRRESWTHGDSLIIEHQGSYMGGELYWKMSDNRVQLFYIDDLIANDWSVT